MYRLLILSLMISGYLADNTLEALRTLQEQLQDIESLQSNLPQTRKRESSPPDHLIDDLLTLLEQEKGFSQKRSTEESDGKGEQKDVTDNKTDKQKGLCSDEREDCKELLSDYPCNHPTMQIKCARTCKACYRCEDTIEKKMCDKFVGLKFCDFKPMVKRMKDLCYKSCGFCRQAAPPACTMSKHGCCWDRTTSRDDKKGSNCPNCLDMRPIACKTFEPSCESDKESGVWMRKHCPVTCKQCKPDCNDDKDFKKLCEEIVMNGNCKSTEISKLFCRKSCKWC